MPTKPTVVVVGSGVSGLVTAYLLAENSRGAIHVALVEAENRLGGHALTVPVEIPSSSSSSTPGQNKTTVSVDLGFQVYNLTTYPLLTQLFDDLGVDTEPSDMSFAFSTDGVEWASHNLDTVFATRSNAVSPRFLGMLRDVMRFKSYQDEILAPGFSLTLTVGEFLKQRAFGDAFINDYFIPMTAAVWSVPYDTMMEYPVHALTRFWANHHLVDPIGARPRWRVVKNRSAAYVDAVANKLRAAGVDVRLSSPVRAVEVAADADADADPNIHVVTLASGETIRAARVVLATHAPDSLSMIRAGSPQSQTRVQDETQVLEAVTYQANRVVLHTDETLMPRDRKTWASWNVLRRTGASGKDPLCVTYWLNRLQNLPAHLPTLLCTLNPIHEPKGILREFTLDHPVYTASAILAQRRWSEELCAASSSPRGGRPVRLAGAWTSNGFHEDGARSGVAAAGAILRELVPGFTSLPSGYSLAKRGPAPTPLSASQSVGAALMDALAESFISRGHMRIVLPSGDELGPFGRPTRADAIARGEPACELRVRDAAMFWRVVVDADIGLGEAFMYEMFTLPRGQDDLVALLNVLLDNREDFARIMNAGPVAHLPAHPLRALAAFLYKMGTVVANVQHAHRANTIEGSRKNIEEHYDLGNDLYVLFLDETMTYSSGIHAHPGISLKDAQLAKIDRIISKARLTPDSRVLEIGCGWGGFAIRAAQTTGCSVTGVTISTEQLAMARDRVKRNGLEHKIRLEFCDYRKLADKIPTMDFDALVSIEMLEAVGHENIPGYFAAVNAALRTGARAVIQVIGMPEDRYQEYLDSSDFIRKHIFPGGHLPCMQAIRDGIHATDLVLEESFDIGKDYAVTLREWRERFTAKRDEILALGYSETFFRKWIFYFAFCEVGFARGYIYDWQLVFEKRDPVADPDILARRQLGPAPKSPFTYPPPPGSTAAAAATASAKGKGGARALPNDFVTGFMLGAWVTLCGALVYDKGTHLLTVPLALCLALAVHAVVDAYDVAAAVASATVSALALAAVSQSQLLNQAVLVGTGALAADLFALVWKGKALGRPLHVAYRAVQLSAVAAVAVGSGDALLAKTAAHLVGDAASFAWVADKLLRPRAAPALADAALLLAVAVKSAVHAASLASAQSRTESALWSGALAYDAVFAASTLVVLAAAAKEIEVRRVVGDEMAVAQAARKKVE